MDALDERMNAWVWQTNVSWYDKSEKQNVLWTKEILVNISDYWHYPFKVMHESSMF